MIAAIDSLHVLTEIPFSGDEMLPPIMPNHECRIGSAPRAGFAVFDGDGGGGVRIPVLRARLNRQASDQAHRRAAAMERTPENLRPRVTTSRLDPSDYDAAPFAISMYPNTGESTVHGQIVIGYIEIRIHRTHRRRGRPIRGTSVH
jgi:hypothetical protein